MLQRAKDLTMQKSLYAAVLLLLAVSYAATASVDELTGQWLHIENQRQQLESQWQRERPLLQQRIELLKAEAEKLTVILDSNRHNLDEVEAEREALLQRQNQLESNQVRAGQLLQVLERQLSVSLRVLHPPVQGAWQSHAAVEHDSVTQHLQSVVDRMEVLGRYQRRPRVIEGMIQLDDGSRLTTQQLYLGSHYAWFVTADGGRAGMGYAKSGHWHWSEVSGPASRNIQYAIEMVEQQRLPEFLTLPLHYVDLSVRSNP